MIMSKKNAEVINKHRDWPGKNVDLAWFSQQKWGEIANNIGKYLNSTTDKNGKNTRT